MNGLPTHCTTLQTARRSPADYLKPDQTRWKPAPELTGPLLWALSGYQWFGL